MTEVGDVSRSLDIDARYVAARRVLLDALTALAPHGDAVILAGAQAIYLHTGTAELAIAPYTTDGDLVLNPRRLGDAPELEAGMTAAGFHLQQTGDTQSRESGSPRHRPRVRRSSSRSISSSPRAPHRERAGVPPASRATERGLPGAPSASRLHWWTTAR